MLYAQVVLGIPVEGPFDYIVPAYLDKKLSVGSRVWVSFRTQKKLGYVVKLTRKTKIKNLKKILEIIDESPILDKNMLLLTKELSDYYCCTFGEAIETALPEDLRKGKSIPNIIVKGVKYTQAKDNREVILIHDLDGQARWKIYLSEIKKTMGERRSVILLFPDKNCLIKAQEIIATNLGISACVLYRKQPRELEEWLKIREAKVNIVVGTRSAVFAPLNNLGLVIIDDEQDSVYKQEQVPHYRCREVAFMRTDIEKARLILGSASPSLEVLYLAKRNKIQYTFIPRTRDFPTIKIIDTELRPQAPLRRNIFSKYLEDAITLTLSSGDKILLFLNRKGFATFAACQSCGIILKCQRCNINLVYHFKDNTLNCHYCNFRMEPPQICPNCNSGYIKFGGIGTERIESELSRIFVQARIKRLDSQQHIDTKDADIFVATSSVIKQTNYSFDLSAVLAIDNSLNRIDLRAAEKTFALLVGILGLTEKKLIIQTHLPNHHCLRALENKNIDIFYQEELRQRRDLNFPPYQHFGLVRLRGKKESKVKEMSHLLFKTLKRYAKDKSVKVISLNPAQPAKLRGNFYWQILLRAANPKEISRFLKIQLRDFSHSGIIVTVDIDPV